MKKIFFLLVTILSSHVNGQNIVFKFIDYNDSLPVSGAAILFHSSKVWSVTKDNGTVSVDKQFLKEKDTITFQHLAYESLSIPLEPHDSGKYKLDTVIFSVNSSIKNIGEVVIKPEKSERIISKVAKQFNNSKPSSYSIFHGILKIHIKDESDSIMFISDALIFWGSNQNFYYKEHGLEFDLKHLAFFPTYSFFDEHYKPGGIKFSPINQRKYYTKYYTSLLPTDDISNSEKFTYNNGPLSEKYQKYYSYKVDSVYYNSKGNKQFLISYSSINKKTTKTLIASGKIIADSLYRPVQITIENPRYPIIFKHNGLWARAEDKGFYSLTTITYSYKDSVLFPLNILVKSSYSNGRKEYLELDIYNSIPFDIEAKEEHISTLFSAFETNPYIENNTLPTKTLLAEKNKTELLHEVKFNAPMGPFWILEQRRISEPKEIVFFETINKIRKEIWESYLKYF